jgi:hypothetical protein
VAAQRAVAEAINARGILKVHVAPEKIVLTGSGKTLTGTYYMEGGCR